MEGPPGAPTLLLLHGWIASAGLNWFQNFESLGRHFRVIAPDLRGHGRGLRSRRRFRLADNADDMAALLEELDAGPVIAVGYSMGGPVAQLLWHRHRERVSGLVLAATSAGFVPVMRERFIFTTAMASLAGTTPRQSAARQRSRTRGRGARCRPPLRRQGRPSSLQRWAAQEMRRHDMRHVIEAGVAIGNYTAKRWIGQVDVPTTVLMTTEDRAVTPDRQQEMAEAIPGAEIIEVADGHMICAKESFAEPILTACHVTADRAA